MRRLIAGALLAATALAVTASPALAENPVDFGTIWLDGAQVRTLLPPSAFPNAGTDPFYRVPGTGGVAAVGPGTGDYHGGAWKVFDVTWNAPQRPLTSAGAVLAAAASGEITIVRNAGADFRCPIQP
ncbi:MAG TPA: hypothetical protein VGR46_06990 [Candidatus Limnocylindria bacterium]|jgi:hypothetical protein|nr:hypothetical protein [Candidatus Limnocylindria bacterium]